MTKSGQTATRHMTFHMGNYDMFPHNRISLAAGMRHAEVELEKANLFRADRDALQRHNANTRNRIADFSGKSFMRLSPNIIGLDKAKLKKMSPYQGEQWPSLTKDFGIPQNVYEADASSLKCEFMIDFEAGRFDDLVAIDPYLPHLQKLGMSGDKISDALLDMIDVEAVLYNEKVNPHPRNKFGMKEKVDFHGARDNFIHLCGLVI